MKAVLIWLLTGSSLALSQEGVPISHWVGAPGSRPGTYREWISAHQPSPLRGVSVKQSKVPGRDVATIAVVCESTLAEALGPELAQYTADVESTGYDVRSYQVAGGTPAELRTLLQTARSQCNLLGALLIGNLPVAWFQTKNDYEPNGYEEWPIDLFYMDLNGIWQDSLQHVGDTLVPGSDGIYDTHTGDVAPEIFVGRLMTSGIGDSVELLRNYFRKDHAFRTDSLVVPTRALVFVDDDWHDWAEIWNGDVGDAFGDRTFYKDQESTRATVYRRNLDSARTWVSVFAHSSSHSHGFYFDQHRQMDYYYGSDYTDQDPPALFYNHFACSFGRYTDTGYGGGRSIFATQYGLGSIASSKAGGMLDFGYFYTPLGQGSSIGEAFRQWFVSRLQSGNTPYRITWHYGMTLLGDPLLVATQYYDVAPVAIAAPAQVVDSGTIVTPQVTVVNHGTGTWSFPVVLRIGASYRQTKSVNGLAEGDSAVVTFDPWTAAPNGQYAVTCSTKLAQDVHPENNVLGTSVIVYSPDVSIAGIVAPTGVVGPKSLKPKALLRNLQPVAEQVGAEFWILDSTGSQIYYDSIGRWVMPLDTHTVSFKSWKGSHAPGNYRASSRVFRPGDRHPENDTASAAFEVTKGRELPDGWSQQTNLPAGSRRKTIDAGGCLAASDEAIFALKGNGTSEFYQYEPWNGAWTQLESLPVVGRFGKRRGVKQGGALAYAGGRVYATKGNGTQEFWEYNPDTHVWSECADLPWGGIRRACMAAISHLDRTYIYLAERGNGHDWSFCRYDPDTNAWVMMSRAGPCPNRLDPGSCLTSDSNGTIYALFGKSNLFLAYDAVRDSWSSRSPIPFFGREPGRLKIKDGTCMTHERGKVLILKGGSNQFWIYDCSTDVWTEGNGLPPGPEKKHVKSGGALVYIGYNDALYATKGGNTLEFWAYSLSGLGLGIEEPRPQPVFATQRFSTADLDVAPNPLANGAMVTYDLPAAGNVSLKLIDLSGRLIAVLVAGRQSAGHHVLALRKDSRLDLPRGVYLLRLETERATAAAKLVIE